MSFEAVWKATRAMKAAGWTVLSSGVSAKPSPEPEPTEWYRFGPFKAPTCMVYHMMFAPWSFKRIRRSIARRGHRGRRGAGRVHIQVSFYDQDLTA